MNTNEKKTITLDDVITLLESHHQRYECVTHHETRDSVITFYFKNGDRTHIEIGDDKSSISVMGRIIGDLQDLEEWIFDAEREELNMEI